MKHLIDNILSITAPSCPFSPDGDSAQDKFVAGQLPLIVCLQGARFLIFVLATWALTRMIPAEEFGLLMLVSVPVALVGLFGDFGLGDGLIRSRVVSPQLCSLLLYCNVAVSVLAVSVMLAVLPIFEWWFETRGLSGLAACYGAGFLLASVAGQYRALVQRQLRILSLEFNDLFVTLASSIASIVLASQEFGVAAMPLGRAAGICVELFGLAWLTRWFPGRPAKFDEARDLAKFGSKIVLAGGAYFVTEAGAKLLLGRFLPLESLGLLERTEAWTKGIVNRIGPLSRRLFYPILGRRFRESASGASHLGETLVRVSIAVWVPIVCLLAVISGLVFSVLLGPEWDRISALAPMAVGGFALWLPLQAASALMLAYGFSGLLLKANIIGGVLRLGISFTALAWGCTGFVAANAILELVFAVVLMRAIAFRTNCNLREWNLSCLLHSIAGTAVGGAVYWLGLAGGAWTLGVAVVLAIAGYLAVLVRCHRDFAWIRSRIRLLGSVSTSNEESRLDPG